MVDDITDQEAVLEQDTLPEFTEDEQQAEAPEQPVPVEITAEINNNFK